MVRKNLLFPFLNNKVTVIDILRTKFNSSKGKLKVGWYSPFPPLENGAAAITYWFVNELCKHKEIELYAFPEGNLIEKKEFPNVNYTTISDKNLDYIIFFGIGPRISKFAKKVRAKIIAIQTVHKFDSYELSLLQSQLLKQSNIADYIFAVTNFGKDFFEKELNREIGYFPLAVDTTKFIHLLNKKNKPFQVLFQSRVCYYKGINHFLETIPFVLKKYPDTVFKVKGVLDKTDLIFHYKGDNRVIYNKTISLLEESAKKFPKNLILDYSWSSYADAMKVYQGADVLVFPSNNEGFGIPIIEAMSCGIPVIALNKPPMNEFIKDKKTGFLINCRKGYENENYNMQFPHPEDIAQKIIWLIQNPKKAKQMGVLAREHIIKNYDLKKVTNKFVRLLFQLKQNETADSK